MDFAQALPAAEAALAQAQPEEAQPQADMVPVAVPAIVVIRRRRRERYTPHQRQRAVRLLDEGYTCRAVARITGRFCGTGTPTRWRQQARREMQRLAREALEVALRENLVRQ